MHFGQFPRGVVPYLDWAQMSKLEIKYVSLDDLRPYAGNARTHSKKQVRQIADSIVSVHFLHACFFADRTRSVLTDKF